MATLTVTFDSGDTSGYALTPFEGAQAAVKSTAPQGGSGSAVEFVKGGQPWAGVTFLSLPAGELITPTAQTVTMSVWAPEAGKTVRLKLEDAANVDRYVEADASTTTAAGWQTLTFNFASSATAALDHTYTFNKASVFFDFMAPASGQTYWFDDVKFLAAVAAGRTADVLAYTWKGHTVLDGVNLVAPGQTHLTDAMGTTSFTALTDSNLALQASRAVPSSETSLTNSAVNLQDAIAILKMIVGLDVNGAGKPLSPYQAMAADYDGNGAVQLTDAIGVLKHVVGLTAPQPTWHFVNELDTTVPAKATLNPGQPQTSISASTSGSSPVHVGLVGYLSGDVDGSFAGAAGALDLDALQSGYFTSLSAASGLNLTQFGVY